MLKAKKKIFKNGLRVITIPMKDNPTITVLVLVGTGSDYEPKEINGISHFLEHMCFKGTENRPTPQSISLELDSLGCQYNAFTGNEYTGYYAKSDAKNFKKVFEIISDIYLNSTFSENEINKEKGVIIEEMNMYEDMPHMNVQDLFENVLYGDQPSGRKIVGTKENIENMVRQNFIDYKNNHYVAEKTVVVVAGSIDNSSVYKEIEKYFGKISTKKGGKKEKTKELQTKPEIFIKYKDTDQTHFVLGFRSFSMFDKKNIKVSMLSAVLGAGMSSRLFIKLREELGVAYYVRASNNASLDHGSFQISAGVNNSKFEKTITEILKECKKLIHEKVSEKELNKVKSFLIGNMKMSLESTDDIANFYGGQELLKNEIKTLDEKIKEVKKITPEDIQKVAKEIFINEKLNLAVIGPIKNVDNLKRLLNFNR